MEGFALVLVMLDLLDVAFGYTVDIVDSEVVETEVDSVVVEIEAVDIVVAEIVVVDSEDIDSVIVVVDILHTAMCNVLHLCVFCIQ